MDILLVAKPFIEPVEMNGTPAIEALSFWHSGFNNVCCGNGYQ